MTWMYYTTTHSKQLLLQDWRSIVALIGKTGKESLKRRVMEFRIRNLTMEVVIFSCSIIFVVLYFNDSIL